ncbi:MAG: transposase [Candidatus Auribacterota bacterium]|nr:transposase [Candidatus Auribacterota bacterium]
MPRANRYIIPRQLYHITHRCHDRSYLLRFLHDRNVYRKWLRKGAARYGVSILGYCLTSNHIHLVAYAEQDGAISRLMQLVEGCVAQQYNRRKERKGAFWEDRFHCTLIDTGRYLWNCLTYIDLNMIRAGIVSHPEEWEWCGYRELMGIRQRYRILDLPCLVQKTGAGSLDVLREKYNQMLRLYLAADSQEREPQWTESLAVGSKSFVDLIKKRFETKRISFLEEEMASESGPLWSIRENRAHYGP